MAIRLQTLVQLTDELVAELDRRAGQLGVSRSRLIRQLLERQLTEDRGTERTRALVDGYRRL
ncbi:MAG: ribbon-helix-helix protein, CopG family, partial [Actinomycetota bacterium]|nr:ribbon-helix-helix protein, CopG family [Actinomycetota bacterium]